MIFPIPQSGPTDREAPDGSPELSQHETSLAYIAPTVVDLGNVRDLTKGSSGSGTADANSQYYWG